MQKRSSKIERMNKKPQIMIDDLEQQRKKRREDLREIEKNTILK